jgi:penicillin-binding protein 1A
MTLTAAFAESRNIPALKLAARVGIHKVIDLARRFGVTSNIPAYLPIALGAAQITLEEQVASYSVFPNDGLRVTPRLVRKVSNADGIVLWEDPPAVKEVIDQPTARTMMGLLRAVTQFGTGAAAAQLNHPLGGKTGTTSDYTDAWFLGFSPSVTCGVWVGYDSNQTLGEKETGAKAALPIWISVMRQAIAGKDNEQFPGDEKSAPLLNASATPPAKPGVSPLATPAKLANASAPKPPMQSTAKPSAAPAKTVLAAKPLVRPALPPPPAPAKAATKIKPALNTVSDATRPKTSR